MTTLITGCAGKLGRQVTKELFTANFKLRATDRAFGQKLPVQPVIADLCDESLVYSLLENCDTLVHLGNISNVKASFSPQDVYKKNCAANANIFQAAMDLDVKNIIFASSIQAFVGTNRAKEKNLNPQIQYLPMDGWAKQNPTNLYGLSKVAGENMLRYYSKEYPKRCFAALRFPYLMLEDNNTQNQKYERPNKQSTGIIDELFSYLYVSDAARLILAIAQNPKPGYHQLFPASKSNRHNKSISELIKTYYPNVALKKPIDEIESLVNIEEIRELFDWQAGNDD